MPTTGPDAGPHNYEIRIPNDFEPISPEVRDPGERAKLESQRLTNYLRSERSADVRGNWPGGVQFSGEYACSTGTILGQHYDLQVPASGEAVVQKYEGGRWIRVAFPTPDRSANLGLQMRIATLRKAAVDRTGGTTPDRPTTTPTGTTRPEATPTGVTVGRREAIVTIAGGRSRMVSAGGSWYDVVALNSGGNEYYANRGGSNWERVTPTGPLLAALQAEAATIRGGSAPTTTPDRPTTTPTGTTSPDRPSVAPTLTPGSNGIERAVNTVLSLRFPEGVGFSPDARSIERYLRNNNVEDPANYARHMTATAENLRAALAPRAGVRGTVAVDGARLVFTSQANDLRLVSNAQFVLRSTGGDNYVIDQGPSSGTVVRYSRNGPASMPDTRLASNYDMYEIGPEIRMYGRDGSLRQAVLGSPSSPTEVRGYSGQGDARNPRPSVIRALQPTVARLPSRDGSPTTADYRLQRGTHYVPESGEPVRSYAEATDPSGSRQARRTEYRALLNAGRTADAARLKASLDADLNANLESVRGWMRNLVTACRGNPKSMTEAVTGVMTFTARATGEGIGTVSGRDRIDRGADLQSPELTVFLGGGHCKDFAFLLQRLCEMGARQYPGTGGAQPLVMASHDIHTSAYYVQEVPRDGGGRGYKLVKMHVLGYEESAVFDTPEQALQQVWERSHSRHATAYDHARSLGDRNVPAGNGLVVFDAPATATANTADFGYTGFADAARYCVRRMA